MIEELTLTTEELRNIEALPVIVGHVSPDWDCIGAIWLLKRYGFLGLAEVRFVNTGNPDPELLEHADAVVDTGRVCDPARLRFDHHHFPGAAANATCATLQVAQHLVLARPDIDFNPIWPMITLIFNGDTGKQANGAFWSRSIGIHALLSAKKAQRLDDHVLLAYGFDLLDTLASSLIAQDAARRTLADHTVYTSDDGLVVALKNAPQGATFAAHENGARLVVFADYARNAIGVMRGGEGQDVHVGHLVQRALETLEYYSEHVVNGGIYDELSSWYRHEAGFFAGRGTAKAPRDDAITVDLVDVARAIDAAWKRSDI